MTALIAFLVVAIAVIAVAQLAQRRALEAERRRAEADLAAQAARVLLGEGDLDEGLALVAERLAGRAVAPVGGGRRRRPAGPDPRREAFALGEAGWLVVPAGLPRAMRDELRERIAPALAPVLAAALERARLQGEVVETAALRQSDVAKTAVLRAVSHDLRSPLTAIVTAGEALRSPTLEAGERGELADAVVSEGTRLSRLIDKLLDMSRLQAGTDRRRVEPIALDEVLYAAAEDVEGRFELSVGELPAVRADAAQLERAFANLLENAARYAGGEPVKVRARALHNRVVVRVVDRGPGHRSRRAGAHLRAVPSRRPRPRRRRAGTGDRARPDRGQRRKGVGRVAARPGRVVRRRAAAGAGGRSRNALELRDGGGMVGA